MTQVSRIVDLVESIETWLKAFYAIFALCKCSAVLVAVCPRLVATVLSTDEYHVNRPAHDCLTELYNHVAESLVRLHPPKCRSSRSFGLVTPKGDL